MSTLTSTDRLASATAALEQAGQKHVLQFWNELTEAERGKLLGQIESIDWREVESLVRTHVLAKPEVHLPSDLQPAPYLPYHPTGALVERYQQARSRGEQLIREGKVAAFVVAGGQGTRLGYDGPKGAYPATPIRKLPLFGVFAEYIRKVQAKYQTTVPWYIMTSPVNDAATRQFLAEHRYFGLDPAQVMIFPQAMMPALDMRTGKVLLESPSDLALSPNGHGGSLKALHTSGALADMKRRGVEHISYVQIDNPSVKVIDPLFIGLHDLEASQMSSKMLPKAHALEKVGLFCLADGRVSVIEYSDMPEAMQRETTPDGRLRFLAGSIAIHAIRRDFVEQLSAGGSFSLPFHRAEKKVPCMDLQTRQVVKPEKPNAVKLETFVFDALPLCSRSIVYETDRVEEFAPIKNASAPGVGDSPATSVQLQVERAARWLKAVGVEVPRNAQGEVDAVIEITPLAAIEAADLRSAAQTPRKVERGSQVLIER